MHEIYAITAKPPAYYLQDAYPLDAQVTHGGQVWTSTVANNVWEPGVYGWTVA